MCVCMYVCMYIYIYIYIYFFSGGSVVKNVPANAGDASSILGREEPKEKEMATHSSILTWKIPGTGEPGGLPSMGSHRVGHDWSDLAAAAAAYASKVMLKILQARLQQNVNREVPDVQAGFRKGRGTRDEIANSCWIIEKAREFQKKHLFLLYWLCQSLWLCGSQ